MSKFSELHPVVQYLLKEMCRRVHANPEELEWTKGKWSTKYCWTTKEMTSFQKWIEKEIQQNQQVREFLCERKDKVSKKLATSGALKFLLSYSWLVVPEKDILEGNV